MRMPTSHAGHRAAEAPSESRAYPTEEGSPTEGNYRRPLADPRRARLAGKSAGGLWLLGFVVAALLMRLLVALPGFADAGRSFSRPDTDTYLQPALALLHDARYAVGPGSLEPETLRPPGFPVFLAGLLALTGRHLHLVAVGLCLVSAMTCWPIFLAGRQFGGARTGLVAAALFAFNLTSVANAPMLLSDTFFCFCVAWQLFFFSRFYAENRLADSWLTFFFNGLGSLVRSVGMYWMAPGVLLVLTHRNLSWRKRLFGAVGAVLIFSALTLPWVWRNHAVGAGWRLDTNTGNALYYHTAAALTSVVTGVSAESLRVEWRRKTEAEFQAHSDRYATIESREDYLLSQARQQIRPHLATYLRLHVQPAILLPDAPLLLELLGKTQTGRGTLDVLRRKGTLAAVRHYFGNQLWLLLPLVPILAWTLLIYLGAAFELAAWLWERRLDLALVFLAFVVLYLVLPGPLVMPRYQLPALPLLCVMAALAIERLRAPRTAG